MPIVMTYKRAEPDRIPGKLRYVHGQCCGYFKATQEQLDEMHAKNYYQMGRKAYLFMVYDDSQEDWCKAQCAPVNDSKDQSKMLSLTKSIIDFDELAKVTAIDSTKLLNGELMASVDATAISTADEKIFKTYDPLKPPTPLALPDRAAIASGTYTFGPTGDYPLLSNLAGDCTTQTGTLRGNQNGHVTGTATASFSHSLNSQECIIDNLLPSRGVFNGGYVLSNYYNSYAVLVTTEGPGTIWLKNLDIQQTLAAIGGRSIMQVNDVSTACTIRIVNYLGNCNAGASINRALVLNGATPVVYFSNGLLINSNNVAFGVLAANANSVIENVGGAANLYTFYIDNKVLTFRNCWGNSTVATRDWYLPGNSAGYNCGTGHATTIGFGTGDDTKITGIVNGDFQSTTYGKSRYYVPAPGGKLDGAGATAQLADNTEGANGGGNRPSAPCLGRWELNPASTVRGKFLVTVPSGSVTSGAHSDFPVLIDSRVSDIPDDFWAAVTAAGGSQCIKVRNEAETLEYDREIVTFNEGSKLLQLWVRVPSLSSSADNTFYIRVESATRQNDTPVWMNAGYGVVAHMDESSGDLANSRTPGYLSFVPQGAASGHGASGIIGSSYLVAASTQTLRTGAPTIVYDEPNVSLTGWMKGQVNQYKYCYLSSIYAGSTSRIDLYTYGGNLYAALRDDGNYGRWTFATSGVLTDNQWHLFHYVFDGAGATDADKLKVFIDGTQPSGSFSNTPVNSQFLDSGSSYVVGANANADVWFDEHRIALASLSLGWAKTEFDNQNDPDSFLSCGEWISLVTSTGTRSRLGEIIGVKRSIHGRGFSRSSMGEILGVKRGIR